MGDGVTREELAQHISYIREDMRQGFTGIHSRLDILNGRTRSLETTTALLQADMDTLQPAKVADAVTSPGAWLSTSKAVWGVLVTLSALGAFVAGALMSLFQKVAK